MKYFLYLVICIAFCSCNTGPPEKDISRCLLRIYDCGEYAKVNSLKIISSEKEEFMGSEMYKVVVSGEVEWTSDCRSFMGQLRAGDKQKFENKTVVMEKGPNGWNCP